MDKKLKETMKRDIKNFIKEGKKIDKAALKKAKKVLAKPIKAAVKQAVKVGKAMGFEQESTEMAVEVDALPEKRMSLMETIAASTVFVFSIAGIIAAMLYDPKKADEMK